jgi:hypothetical protein
MTLEYSRIIKVHLVDFVNTPSTQQERRVHVNGLMNDWRGVTLWSEVTNYGVIRERQATALRCNPSANVANVERDSRRASTLYGRM